MLRGTGPPLTSCHGTCGVASGVDGEQSFCTNLKCMFWDFIGKMYQNMKV